MILFFVLAMSASISFAAVETGSETRGEAGELVFNSLVKKEISRFYGDARVDLTTEIRWTRGAPSFQKGMFSVLGDDGKGNVHLLFKETPGLAEPGSDANGSEGGGVSEAWVGASAWKSARIAIRRIRPGELLEDSGFTTQQINVLVGQGHEYRGILFPAGADMTGLEAVQTVMEGQYLLSTSTRRVPDIRRGDSVSIHLISGDLNLSTLGTAEEPAYMNSEIRVMTKKGKREFSGKLRSGGVVEVHL